MIHRKLIFFKLYMIFFKYILNNFYVIIIIMIYFLSTVIIIRSKIDLNSMTYIKNKYTKEVLHNFCILKILKKRYKIKMINLVR